MAKNNPEEDAVQKSLQDTPDNPPEQQDHPDSPPETTQSEGQPGGKPDGTDTATDKAETEKVLGEQHNPPEQPVLVPVASGEAPVEGAEMVAVKTHNATRFYRCGLEFTREIRIVERSAMDEADWQRLLAEPNLTVQGVVLMTPDAAYDEDVPQ